MAANFTAIVQPFLRLVDPSPMDSLWTLVNLGPKAYLGVHLFPSTVPEPAMHNMNILTFLYYFYCTQNGHQSAWSFLVMSLCLFFMYRLPLSSFPYTDASSFYMLAIIAVCYPGCEFALDVFLMVGIGVWLTKKFEGNNFEKDKVRGVKFFLALWFVFMAFFLLPNIRVASERKRYANSSIIEDVGNIQNVSNSSTAATGHILVDEM